MPWSPEPSHRSRYIVNWRGVKHQYKEVFTMEFGKSPYSKYKFDEMDSITGHMDMCKDVYDEGFKTHDYAHPLRTWRTIPYVGDTAIKRRNNKSIRRRIRELFIS